MTPRLAVAVLLVSLGATIPGTRVPGLQAAPQAPAADQGVPDRDPAPDGQDPPVFRGRVDLVRVDVMVTDRDGRPVTDLTADDFELLEEGRPQTIEQFRRVDLTESTVSRGTTTVRSVADDEAEAAREDVRLFAFFLDDYHVRSNNAVAVREPLVRFIRTQLRPTDLIAVMYPLTPVDEVSFTRNHESVIRAIEGFQGRKYNYTPTNVFEQNYVRASTQDIERIRNTVVIDALTALATRMGGLREGRKAIVFVSEGFTTLLPPQMRRGPGEALGTTDPRLIGPEVGFDEELAQVATETELYQRMRDVFVAAARYNAAIYSLDPRGTAAFEFDQSDTLGLGAVSMEADRRARRATAVAAAPEVAQPVQQALASIASSPRAQRHIQTWVGVEPGDGGRTRVRLVWEPARSVPGERRDPVTAVVVTAAAGNDDVFSGPVPAAAGGSGVAGPQQAVFDAPPGRLDLRLVVEGDAGRRLDEDVVSIEVPDLTAPELRISTPRVHRGRTARDIQAVIADGAAVPVAAREFSRTERLLIRFDVQAPGGAAIQPTAALLNRTGQKIVDLPVAAAAAGGTHQIDLGLGSVPAGEYLVEITAAGDAGDVKELVAFRLGS